MIEKLDVWPPFWHRFFDFFQKWRKCEISEEYNAKRGSKPSKAVYLRIDFSSNFHVFSEPPSRGHFWKVRAAVYSHKCDFGPIFDFPAVHKSADTGRCQAFQIREASTKASLGGLPSLPPSVHLDNQTGSKNRTFLVHFRTFLVHFRYQILASFLACLFSGIFGILVALWLPLGPFWAFWMHFGLHFGSLLAHFYLILASFFPTSFLH